MQSDRPSTSSSLILWIFFLSLLLLLLVSSALVSWRVQSFELDMARARAERQVDRISTEVERSLALGVSPYDMSFLEPLMRRQIDKDKAIVAGMVVDANGQRVLSLGRTQLTGEVKAAWQRQAIAKRGTQSTFTAPPRDWTASVANDSAGVPVATLWLAYDRSDIYGRGKQVALELGLYGGMLGLAAMFAFWLLTLPLRRAAHPERMAIVLGALVAVAVLTPIVQKTRDVGRPLVTAQVASSANELGDTLSGDIRAALDQGVPSDKLSGVEDVFRTELSRAAEFNFVLLARGEQRVAQSANDAASLKNLDQSFNSSTSTSSRVPVVSDLAVVVGYPRDSVSRKLLTLLGDVLFAVIIALVLVIEMGRGTAQIQRGSDQTASLARIRLFVFFTALSEELLRPFFAQFASEFDSPIAGLTPAWLVALPIMTFMTTVALAQPLGPILAQRFELRRAMTVSCLAGGAGLILSGFVNDVVLLTILRGLSGVAYGAALIFAQMAILRLVSSSEERGSVMAQYALAIVAGGIVGPALGAISAELFGYSISLGVCAAAMVVAALFALRLPVFANDAVEVEARKGVMRAFLGEWQALATALLAAIPARLLAAAVLLLLAPLYLIEVGERTSVVGRVLPLYFLAFYLVTRVAASLSDKLGGRAGFVIAGGVLSALACFALPYFGGILGAALCCALLGLGQGIMYAPMITLVTELVERGGRMSASDSVAAFRFVERVGSVFSAPLAAALVGVIGIHRSVLVLGGGALICILVLMIVLALPTRGGPRSTETTPPLGATG